MVTAIITTFKREPSILLRALESVLAQTYRDMEIIVVDDSPSDYQHRADVRIAVEKCQKRKKDISIRYIAHPVNKGACMARNTGLVAAEGEYIAYLDDDDEWLPTKIEKQMIVINNSDAALVYCGCYLKKDRSGTCQISGKEYVKGNVFNRLLYGNFITSTSIPLIKKDCLREVGGFDPFMQASQDYDVWLRLAKQYEIDYVDEPLVLYHVHEGERITTNPKKRINGLERINKKYASYLEIDRKLWWTRNMVITNMYALNHERRKAIALWAKCVLKCPERVISNSSYLFQIMRTILNGQHLE